MFEEHDDMRGRTDIYLHLLHSSTYAAAARQALSDSSVVMPEGVRAFLRGIDFERLAHEQQHRVGDLCAYLRRVCPWHTADVGAEGLQRLATAYANSSAFTLYRGRTLEEDYCLFAYDALREAGELLAAEIARLDGVTAGLTAAPEQSTPWPSHERCGRREAFASPYRFVFADGDAPAFSAVAQPSRIEIEIDASGASIIDCTPLGVQ